MKGAEAYLEQYSWIQTDEEVNSLQQVFYPPSLCRGCNMPQDPYISTPGDRKCRERSLRTESGRKNIQKFRRRSGRKIFPSGLAFIFRKRLGEQETYSCFSRKISKKTSFPEKNPFFFRNGLVISGKCRILTPIPHPGY